jgi:hypothetical protein
MERFRWITHHELRILVNDYSGLTGNELVRQVVAFRKQILALNQDRLFLLIRADRAVNVHGQALAEFAKNAKVLQPRLARTAVVGATETQHTIINTVNEITGLGARAFDNEEAALAWLVE